MRYQICNACVMDTSDTEIVFDEEGICNHCKEAKQMIQLLKAKKREINLDEFYKEVQKEGKGKKYDCIIGISGGVDSCYVMHLAKKNGLRPLAVHIDNCWNTELAEQNIKNLLAKLEIDLFTYKVDWQEFRDLQLAFLKASTPDSEIPTDHVIRPVLGMLAHQYKCKYIIMGQNSVSEYIIPRTWSHGHSDWKYIKNIYKRYGNGKLKKYPYFTRPDFDYFSRKFVWFNVLDYMDYDKEAAKELLINEYDWKDYGGKHHESFYTRFYQTYILPVKFGYDKRRMHFSSLIAAGQMTREDAINQLKESPYEVETLERDIEYFCEKMQISHNEFTEIMNRPPLSYWDYPNSENDFIGRTITKLVEVFSGVK